MFKDIFKSWLKILFLLFVALILGGCNGYIHDANDHLVTAPSSSISVYQLAGRLGLRIDDYNSYSATLRNSANTVVVYPDPNGKVYVNGEPIGSAGGIVASGDLIFLPEAFVSRIRSSLKQPTPPTFGPAPTMPQSLSTGRVVIDPGHGGKDPGATGINGLHEKDVNLDVARMAGKILGSRGVDVVLTRDSDIFIELNDRAAISNRRNPDLFVSIHADAAENHAARGFTIYMAKAGSWNSYLAGKRIATRFGQMGVQDRGLRKADYRVLVRTRSPAVLVELGFLSNGHEAARLSNPKYRRALAVSLAEGIVDYLNR